MMLISSLHAQSEKIDNPALMAYVGTFSSPLGDVLPTQVDLPPGNGRGIHAFRVDRASGALSPSSVFELGTSPSCLVANVAGTRMYSTNETDRVDGGESGSVSAFAIDPENGALTLINSVSSGGAGPTYASIPPSGKYLLVANYFGGSISVLPILPDGSLGKATDVKKDEGEVGPTKATHAPPGSFAISGHDVPHAHMIQTDPSGRFVLHVNLGLDKIFIWKLDQKSGVLTANEPAFVSLPPGDGPRHFAFHPNGKWFYSLQEEGSTVVLFDYDSEKGQLTPRQTISSLPPGYAGSNFCSEILVSADGRFVYAGNRLHDGIAVFAVGETGELSFVTEEWTRGDYPRSFNFDPTGNFLYSCNQRADNLATFRVDKASGRLTFTEQYTPVGNPSAIVFVDLAQIVTPVTASGQWLLGEVEGGEEVVLPQLERNITAAYFANDPKREPLTVGFNEDATKVTLQVPEGDGGSVILEVAENTTQFPDGRIVLSALDARVEGDRAKLETHPGNHRIGFWSNIQDSVHWDYKATRPGMYDVELTYSVANGELNEIECTFGGKTLRSKLVNTGSWYHYTTVPIGRVYIEKSGMLPVKVRGVKIMGGAVMNLKALTLRPAPEGKEITQADDGTIELDAHDATVHGVLLQYERKPQKLCLGYWANPNDWASWTFPANKPGKFKVLLTQGCGSGHGGSEVAIHIADQTIDFTVEETGGFQNWRVRDLGEVTLKEAGSYQLEVRPVNKAKVAVMDIRKIRLMPVE